MFYLAALESRAWFSIGTPICELLDQAQMVQRPMIA
jgi:hypothetical protein